MLNFRVLLAIAAVGAIGFTGCKKDVEDDGKTVLEPIVLGCNDFKSDMVLKDDPARPVDYIVPCVMAVEANIVVKQGVVIEFRDDAGISVNGSGTFKIEGTASEKVVLTGVNKIKGSWRGVIYFSKSVMNTIDHAVISYAGGNSFNSNNDRANLICYNCKIGVANTELSHGKEHGFNAVYSSSEILTFSNNVVTDNAKYPINSSTLYGHAYNGTNDFSGNGQDYIFLRYTNNIQGNYTWQKTNVPYLIDGSIRIGDNQSLTVAPGSSILFEDESGLRVDAGGYFHAEGTVDDKIYLGGLVEQPGSWLGIINYSNDQRNIIDHAEIAYAGGGPHNSNGDLGAIVLWSSAYQKVANTIIRDNPANAPCAINAPYNGETIVLSGNTIINIASEECQ